MLQEGNSPSSGALRSITDVLGSHSSTCSLQNSPFKLFALLGFNTHLPEGVLAD